MPCQASTRLSRHGGCCWWGQTHLFRGRTISEFVLTYERRLEQFLQAMQRAERARSTLHSGKPLSSLMRESWLTKRFRFNYAARKPFDVDVLFNNCLNDGDASVESLDEEVRAGLEPFIEAKMQQLRAYDEDCKKCL